MVKMNKKILDEKVSGSGSHIQADSPAAPPQQGKSTSAPAKPPKRTGMKKLQSELGKLRTENSELQDKLLRKMAEFDNFRKRNEREYVEIITHANGNLVQKLLPVIDDLERSLNMSPHNKVTAEFKKGIELIYSKFLKALEDTGLRRIESIGTEFDPDIHEAIMQLENSDVPSKHIIETFEKGYYFNDKVIRHAKVSVNK